MVRFWNDEVVGGLSAAVGKILSHLQESKEVFIIEASEREKKWQN